MLNKRGIFCGKERIKKSDDEESAPRIMGIL
jgi:hypothetical protein